MTKTKRFFIILKKLFGVKGIQQTQNEKLAFSICRKLMLDEESILMIAPLSNKKYIKNENENIFVVINPSIKEIMIVNHIYSYTIFCESKNFEKLIHFFDNQLEKRKIDLENEIMSNIKHSLENIYNRIGK